ncbi:hypothetical protein GE09DRAFT_303666 [Coniochaeta sp. 2T2.1]|nr:hypothetical protein GE09DRAFT_303666 [Coniochaeta sp. 2T2.1]
MTHAVPVLSINYQFSGLSYTTLYLRDFKHLRTEPVTLHKGPPRSSLAPIPSKYVAQSSPRRSMVTKRPSSTTTPRSAGQATSPQNTSRSTQRPPPGSHRASPGIEHTRHGNSPRTTSSTVNNMRYSPAPGSESDSCSDSCNCSDSDAEHETDFSSRATIPESDYDDTEEDALARRKREIVDGSMFLFRWTVYKWFAEVCGIVTHNGGEGGRGTKRSADRISGRQSTGQAPPGGKKRQLHGDGGGVGEEEDSDQEGGGKLHKKAKPDPRFACPYYKHDPVRYRNHRTCPGPGFTSVHRVKEHLWRRHMMPKFSCAMCNHPFESNPDLFDHVRTSTDCFNQNHGPADGIDEAKHKQLKARLKGSPTEREKWESMYRILFPDDDVIPTPYYEDEEAKSSSSKHQLPEGMSHVAYLLRTDYFPKVRRAIERDADEEIEGVSKRLRTKYFNMAADAVFQAMRVVEFPRSQQQQQQQSSTSQPASPRSADSGLATPEPQEVLCVQPQQQQQQQQPLIDLSAFDLSGESNYTFEATYDYNFGAVGAEQFDFQDILAGRSDDDGCASVSNRDSAYGTVNEFQGIQMGDLVTLGFGN